VSESASGSRCRRDPRVEQTARAIRTVPARHTREWGYRRIAGELAHLGRRIAPSTVWAILKKAGIDPAPLFRN
jgi:putative transposase